MYSSGVARKYGIPGQMNIYYIPPRPFGPLPLIKGEKPRAGAPLCFPTFTRRGRHVLMPGVVRKYGIPGQMNIYYIPPRPPSQPPPSTGEEPGRHWPRCEPPRGPLPASPVNGGGAAWATPPSRPPVDGGGVPSANSSGGGIQGGWGRNRAPGRLFVSPPLQGGEGMYSSGVARNFTPTWPPPPLAASPYAIESMIALKVALGRIALNVFSLSGR